MLLASKKTTWTRVSAQLHPIAVTASDNHLSDAGLDAVEKKFGQGKIDPVAQRGTNEKVTDGIREGLNKFLPESKKLPSKVSFA